MTHVTIKLEVLDECRCGARIQLYAQGDPVTPHRVLTEADIAEMDAYCPQCKRAGTLQFKLRFSQRLQMKETF